MSEFKGLFEPKKANEPYEFYLERLQDDCRRLHDICVSEPLRIYVSDEVTSDRQWAYSSKIDNDPQYVLWRKAQRLLETEGKLDASVVFDIITYVEDCKKLIKQYTQMTPLHRKLFMLSRVYYEKLGYEVSDIAWVVIEEGLFSEAETDNIKRMIYRYIEKHQWVQGKLSEWINL